MALTPEQSARVKYLLEGGWGRAARDDVPEYWTEFDRVLAHLQSPEELHEFVDRWNWDAGTEPLRRALAHPLCDRGTALLIYWRIDPLFYLLPQYNTPAKLKVNAWPEAVMHWETLRKIERRLAANDFPSARIPYDPTNDRGRDLTKQRPKDPKINVRKALPAAVFEAVGR